MIFPCFTFFFNLNFNIPKYLVPLLDNTYLKFRSWTQKKKKSGNHIHLHFYCHADMYVLLCTVSSSKDYYFLSFPCPSEFRKIHINLQFWNWLQYIHIFKAYFATASRISFSLLFTLGKYYWFIGVGGTILLSIFNR